MRDQLFRELLTYMMENSAVVFAAFELIMVAKNLERIGDHTTNVAETLYFLVHGTPLAQARPKGDRSSLAIVRGGPPRGEVDDDEETV